MALSNYDYLEEARNESKTFASETAEITKEEFETRGIQALKSIGTDKVNEFFLLSLKAVLNKIRDIDVKDKLEIAGFGESYENITGEFLQRMYVQPLKPISPKYKNLVQYGSVDPYTIRQPKVEERFYRQNFDYQNLLTLSDTQVRKAFMSIDGLNILFGSFIKNLDNDYKLQKYLAKLEALSMAINSPDLKAGQKVEVELSNLSAQSLTDFILAVKNLVGFFDVSPINSAYNSMGFASAQEKGDLVLLVRYTLGNEISTKVLASAFHKDELNLDVKIIPVENFGGIIYEDKEGNKLEPVYDGLGSQIGFNQSGSKDDPLVTGEDLVAIDTNEKINAVLCDKRILLSSMQIPYEVEAIRNPAGRYNNYWASQPNGTIAMDNSYNMIVFSNPTNTASASTNTASEDTGADEPEDDGDTDTTSEEQTEATSEE